jgi:predicted nucleotidyltransferase
MEEKKLKLKKIEVSGQSPGILNALYWFFAYPETKITLTELSKKLVISKKTASKIVNELAKEGFLVIEKIGKSWAIYCNQEHIFNRTLKISYNLSLIYGSGIIAEIYKKIGNLKAIILFGSYRKGDDISKSDLDIAIEVIGKDEMKIMNIGTISKLGHRKDVPVNLYVFSRSKIDSNMFANIANGIVINGFLEVKA